MRWSAAFLFFLLAACRHQPQAYTLTRQGNTQLLTPPASKPELKNARKHPTRNTGCDVESESFSLAWRGNTAHLTVKTETYFAPPESPRPVGTPGITISESGPRMYSDALAQIEKFRGALAAREDAGCLRDDESSHLRQAMTEAFPFPPQIAAYLRFGTYTQTGSIDLIPGFFLRLVSPNGAEPDVSFYAVVRTPDDDRVRITLASGAGKALVMSEAPGYYRYLYWTGASAHNFRTTILGAPDRKTLQDATGRFLADPETYCVKPEAAVFCQSIAANVGMNAGFHVRVNSSDVFVRIGGTFGEALGEAQDGLRVTSNPRSLPQNVAARRRFHGKLVPITFVGKDIFSLVLMPGDEITF